MLYGWLISPSRAPILPMCTLALLATFNVKWLAVLLLYGGTVTIIMGIGRTLASRAYDKRLVVDIFRLDLFNFEEVKLQSTDFSTRFNLIRKSGIGLAAKSTPNSSSIAVFKLSPKNRSLYFAPQCFPGFGPRPPVLLLTELFDEVDTETGLFEIFHELGHASSYSADTEALAYVEPILIALAVMALCLGTKDLYIWVFSLVYGLNRLTYWLTRRLKVEPEIIADTFAVHHLGLSGVGAGPAALQARYLSNTIRRHRNRSVTTRGLAQRLGMLLINVQLLNSGKTKRMNLGAVTYSFSIAMCNVVIASAGIWAAIEPLPILILAGGAFVVSGATMAALLAFSGELEDLASRKLSEVRSACRAREVEPDRTGGDGDLGSG